MIRKLLRKQTGDPRGEENKLDESVSDTEDPENDSDTTLEISISVPNLSDIVAGNVSSPTRPLVQRSISDTHVSREELFNSFPTAPDHHIEE